jgi:Molybdopterin cofactor-binding domain
MKDLTLGDIAWMVGVSPATASRVINNLVGPRSKARAGSQGDRRDPLPAARCRPLPGFAALPRDRPAHPRAGQPDLIERHFSMPMAHQNPLETRGCAVRIDPFTDEVTVWSSTQAPFHIRKQVADILGVLERIRTSLSEMPRRDCQADGSV